MQNAYKRCCFLQKTHYKKVERGKYRVLRRPSSFKAEREGNGLSGAASMAQNTHRTELILM